MPQFAALQTPWMEQPSIPWQTYPRPQMRRDSFLCLNGLWRLSCAGADWGQILVPYPPESRLSGIGRGPKKGQDLVYERSFSLPEGFFRGRVLLHFGAVDQCCRVFLNDVLLGEHRGGYLPFSFDITAHLGPENRLRVEVRDDMDPDLPYGKQRPKRGGMWYTGVSGIWQTVWLESVPEDYIRELTITPSGESVTVSVSGGAGEMGLVCQGKTYPITHGTVTFRPERLRLWSPEDPYLYDFTVYAGQDRVESYFALRTVEIRQTGDYARIFLNGKPLYFHGLLDQGYYADGLYLPGSPQGYRYDITAIKDLGFNTLRKHIKIEPEEYYYLCDKLGMLVFQDLVNCGPYSYLMDTVLPTLGQRRFALHRRPSRKARAFFREHARETLAHLHNHPCIVLYTLFNEGWGQHQTQELYEQMKALAPDRIWNAASGWFHNSQSDVQSEHIYFGSLDMVSDRRRPLLLTEFGGYSWPVEGHRFNLDQEYGYQKYKSRQAFGQALERLYREEILPQVATGLCGTILTQVSDVEDETNGLLTYDRQVVKGDRGQMRAIAGDLQAALDRACAAGCREKDRESIGQCTNQPLKQ